MTANILRGSFNGLSWGPTTVFRCESLTGLDDLPEIIDRDAAKATADGVFVGSDLLGALYPTLKLGVYLHPGTDAALRGHMDTINAAFGRLAAPVPLRFWNLERYVLARPRSRSWSDHASMVNGTAICTVRFKVADAGYYIGVP